MISVIIPTLNEEETIASVVDFAMAQKHGANLVTSIFLINGLTLQ